MTSNIISARLLDDWILVRVEPPADKTDSGLHLARMADFAWTEYGEVLAIGNGVRDPKTGIRKPVDGVAVGDRIVFSHRPSNDKMGTEALWGKGAQLMRLAQIDGVVDLAAECTCEAIAANMDPSVLLDGQHHPDCPSYACGVMTFNGVPIDGALTLDHVEHDDPDRPRYEQSPVTAREASGAMDGGGPA